MRTLDGIDEVTAAVGEDLGAGDWHTVTQETVDKFADVTGDHQWIHVDAERAATGPFGGRVAHGYLTLSLLPMLARDVYEFAGMAMKVNYGLDKVRFPAPERVGSRVRARVALTGVEPGSRGIRVTLRHTVEVDGSASPGCVADTVALLVPLTGDR